MMPFIAASVVARSALRRLAASLATPATPAAWLMTRHIGHHLSQSGLARAMPHDGLRPA